MKNKKKNYVHLCGILEKIYQLITTSPKVVVLMK